MTKNNKARRVSSPLVKRILAETTPLRKKQIQHRIDLACRIAGLIKSRGNTLSAFAQKLERQPSEISKWVSGTHNFTVDTLIEIAFHLEVSLSYLLQANPVQVVSQTKIEVVVRTLKEEQKYQPKNWELGYSLTAMSLISLKSFNT